MKVSRSRSGSVSHDRIRSRSRSAGRSFANTVASWYDGGAPGCFVPTYKDWRTSGALWVDAQTQATALEQAIWMNMDRSRNLRRGPEMITNGDFAAGSTGWSILGSGSPNWVISPGVATASVQASSSRYLVWNAAGMVSGRVYDVAFDVASSNGVGGVRLINNTDNGSPYALATGRFSCKFVAGGVNPTQVWIQAGANWAGSITNISIKEIPGAHRIQPTLTSRSILTARKNLLVNSMLQGGGSAPTGWAFSFGTGASTPAGSIGVNTVYRQTANAERPFLQSVSPFPMVGDGAVTLSAEVGEIYSGTIAVTQLMVLNTAVGGTYQYYINGVAVSQSATVPKNSKLEMTYTYAGANGTGLARVGLGTSGPATGDVEFSRPMLTRGGRDLAGRYQWTGLVASNQADYDAVGFPVGLRYDGIDDWSITTGNVDFTGTDKVTVAMAVRKQSDASIGLLMELGITSASTPGTFGLFGPGGPGNGNFSWRSMGTVSGVLGSVGTFPAPVNAVVRAIADIAAPNNTVWVNGVSVTTTSDRGTGNFASAPIYFGRRGGTGLSFDGIEHGHLVIGNLRSAEEAAYADQEFAKNFSEALA